MTPFRDFAGVAAPLPLANVNTDAIIPSPWLRSARADYGRGLFAGWRFDEGGRERPDFVLNRPPFRDATILFAGANFGCGSSREAAAWALKGFGFRCVAAPSFADIFYENAFRNGILPALISEDDLARAVEILARRPSDPFGVDLTAQRIAPPEGAPMLFEIPAFRRDMLLRGDDEIDVTLRFSEVIERFSAEDRGARPWLYEPVSGGLAP